MKDLFLGLGESLVGKTCGFLGLGKIGLATARRQKKTKKTNGTKKQNKIQNMLVYIIIGQVWTKFTAHRHFFCHPHKL